MHGKNIQLLQSANNPAAWLGSFSLSFVEQGKEEEEEEEEEEEKAFQS